MPYKFSVADGFDPLRQLLARGELVAFVGAGLSKPGGLPLWSEFVQAIRAEAVRVGIPSVELDDIDRAIASNESIDALTELERYLGPANFARLVVAQLDDRNGPGGRPRPVPDVVEALAALAPGLRAIITTNLDAFIPRALPREWQSFERLTGDLASRRHYTFRIHGAIHDRETWVLTRSEYDRVMDREPLYHTYFSAVFISQPILFVGFGLADPHFDRIAQKIRALARGQPPRHFALVHENEITPGRRRKLGECGIELLGYASHDALPAILRSLAGPGGSNMGYSGGGGSSGAETGASYGAAPSSSSMAPTLVRSQPVPSGTPMAPPPSGAHQGHQAWELPQQALPFADERPYADKRPTPTATWAPLIGITIVTLVILVAMYGLEVTNEPTLEEPNASAETAQRQKEFQETLSRISSFIDHDVFEKLGRPTDHSREHRGFPLLGKSSPSRKEPSIEPKFEAGSWESAVIDTMSNMKVGAYAAKGNRGTFKFQVVVCKDGKVKSVAKKGGTLSYDGQSAVRLALEQLKLPVPPPKVAAQMKSDCAKIRHTFTWSMSGVK